MLDSVLIEATLFLNHVGIRRLPFSRLRWPRTYRQLCFVAANYNDLKWRGKDLFLEKNLGVEFHLGKSAFYNMETYFQVRDKIRFSRNGDQIYADIEGLKFQLPFPSGVIELKETFIDKQYGQFNVRNSVVLDVGAFIGDSALYFAMNGAKKVAAYEPAPPTLKIAQTNIALNHYENIIKVYGEAIGIEEGTVKINYASQMPGMTSQIWDMGESICFEAKVKPLYSAIKDLGYVDLLKMDCEGAEWSIIRDAAFKGKLDEVENIVMEVHGGSIFEMEKLLEKAQFKRQEKRFYKYGGDWYLIASKNPKKQLFFSNEQTMGENSQISESNSFSHISDI